MKGMRMSANTAPELLAMAAMSIPDAGTVAVQDTEVAGDEDLDILLRLGWKRLGRYSCNTCSYCPCSTRAIA
jgi:hypothetical protein